MNAKFIAMAAAAAAAATSAQAADLPTVAEPVDYVQVCDSYGAGFFKIPGKDTCVKIGGRIRTQLVSGNLSKSKEGEKYGAYVRGYVYLTSMTDTEFGMIKTFTELYNQVSQDGTGTPKTDRAYVQFSTGAGDFLIGHVNSKFDGFTGYAKIGPIGRDWSDKYVLQAAYTASLGNGVTATVALEDASYRGGDYVSQVTKTITLADGTTQDILVDKTVDQNKANLVGALKVSQGWGYFKLAGAAGSYTNAANKAKYGYAAAATANVKLDMIAPGVEATFQAAYAKSALAYLGTNGTTKADINDLADVKGYAFGAGFKAPITEDVALGLEGSHLRIEEKNRTGNFQRNVVNASLGWTPASGLLIALDAAWSSQTDKIGNPAGKAVKDTRVGTRVQYTF